MPANQPGAPDAHLADQHPQPGGEAHRPGHADPVRAGRLTAGRTVRIPPMTLEEVLAELESLGTEQNRKIYRRHGGTEPILGVSFANLYSLRRRIKRDQPLAVALWETRISEAQFLATMIADPQA